MLIAGVNESFVFGTDCYPTGCDQVLMRRRSEQMSHDRVLLHQTVLRDQISRSVLKSILRSYHVSSDGHIVQFHLSDSQMHEVSIRYKAYRSAVMEHVEMAFHLQINRCFHLEKVRMLTVMMNFLSESGFREMCLSGSG